MDFSFDFPTTSILSPLAVAGRGALAPQAWEEGAQKDMRRGAVSFTSLRQPCFLQRDEEKVLESGQKRRVESSKPAETPAESGEAGWQRHEPANREDSGAKDISSSEGTLPDQVAYTLQCLVSLASVCVYRLGFSALASPSSRNTFWIPQPFGLIAAPVARFEALYLF